MISGKSKWKSSVIKKYNREWWQEKEKNLAINKEKRIWIKKREKGTYMKARILVGLPKFLFCLNSKWISIKSFMSFLSICIIKIQEVDSIL